MSRITPNQKKAYNALNSRLTQYVMQVQSIYDMVNTKVAKLAIDSGYDGSAEFFFRDYPEYSEAIKDIQAQFVGEMQTVIMRGTGEEWRQSNLIQDLLADKVLKHYRAQVHGKRFKKYYQTNSEALKAFQQRKDRGMNLSAKLWGQAEEYTKETEAAISCTISNAIEKGMSAITLSKRLSKYLQDYPSLQHDYWETYGKAANIHDCEYRSIRLARSEINMAYRTAEQERWKQFDFITGYEIKLSGNHPAHDICDMLAGKYPKNFKWTGWHPNDMCYAIPIIMSDDEYWSDDREEKIEELTPKMNDDMVKWAKENEDRISDMRERNTLPYFFKDNELSIVTPINDAAYKERTGRSTPQPVGNVEIFADRKYAKLERDGSIYYDIYGTRNEVRRQIAQWNTIQQNITDIEGEFDDACKAVVGGRKDIMFSGLSRKDRGSAIRKADEKFNGDLSQCTDLIRCTFACKGRDYEKVCNAVRCQLKLKYDMSTAQYMHLSREDAYICRFMNPEFKNGVVGEIMVNPFEMVAGRESRANSIKFIGEKNFLAIERKAKKMGVELHQGHVYYEAARAAKTVQEQIELYAKLQEYYTQIQKLML